MAKKYGFSSRKLAVHTGFIVGMSACQGISYVKDDVVQQLR